MLIRLQSFFSAFVLALFLFPLVEKEVHAFQHADAFHCKATDKHFHEQEHSCPICDFIVPVGTAPSRAVYNFEVYASSSIVLPFSETKIFSSSKYFVSLRAPPVFPEGTPSQLI